MAMLYYAIENIRTKVYKLLLKEGKNSFDYNHVKRVEELCIEIALQRELDCEIAQLIGLLHDIGRIDGKVYGQLHSEKEAEIASNWLELEGINDRVKFIIIDAIRFHSRKKEIHSPYAELIKDCDSLAHKEEFSDELSKYELARCQMARLEQVNFIIKSPDVITEIYFLRINELDALLGDIKNISLRGKVVRNIRVNIRIIRAIIWLIENDEAKGYKKTDKQLKSIFKLFEQSRKLSVFKKSLKKNAIPDKKYKKINLLIKNENKRIKLRIMYDFLDNRKIFDSKPNLFNTKRKVSKPTIKEINVEDRFKTYKSTLKKVDIQNLQSLHRLRVSGKKIKYLIEEGIITIDNKDDIELLNDYHEVIGCLNDINENCKMLSYFEKSKKLDLSKKEKARLVEVYKTRELELLKEAKFLLFKLKKRWL